MSHHRVSPDCQQVSLLECWVRIVLMMSLLWSGCVLTTGWARLPEVNYGKMLMKC